MRARISDDGNWILLTEYTEREQLQMKSSLTKKIRNWMFNPLVKKKLWDGGICFLDSSNRIPVGLISKVKEISNRFNLNLEIQGEHLSIWNEFDPTHFDEWALNFSSSLEKKPRDYQIDAAKKIIQSRRSISELATSAGKTMIMFIVFSYLKHVGELKRMLIVVPNTNLIIQTAEAFKEYSRTDSTLDFTFQMISGESNDKERSDAQLVIGTFQSLVKLEESWFKGFDCICVDEAHFTNASSVKKVISKCASAKFKFGLSGTLQQDDTADALTIQAFIGPMINKVTPNDLFEKKVATPVNIKVVRLVHTNENLKKKLFDLRCIKGEVSGDKQLSIERELIIRSNERFRVVCDMIKKSNNNSLVLFQNIKDDYGRRIYDQLREETDDREIFYVDGSTSSGLRDDYKKSMEEANNRILVASFGTFSTGISINNIHNIFFVESYKSEKVVKQSIGRGMRLNANKDRVTIIDFQDDLSWKGHDGKSRYKKLEKNYLLKHGEARIEIYKNEGFPFKVYTMEI